MQPPSPVGIWDLPLTLSDDMYGSRRCHMSACVLRGDALEVAAAPLLGVDESARVTRAVHPRRRTSFLRGRVAAKHALAAVCDQRIPAHEFEIASGVFDQPLVISSQPNLGVSLSHTDRIAVAVAFPESHPLGVDVEHVSNAHESMLHGQMAPGEFRRVSLRGLCDAEMLTLLWASKEAASKVLRGGLAVNFHALEVAQADWRDGIAHLRFASFAHLRVEAIVAGEQALAVAVPTRCTFRWNDPTARNWLLACVPLQSERQ
jgi:4'-phosphopantetheinyl transferase EntD